MTTGAAADETIGTARQSPSRGARGALAYWTAQAVSQTGDEVYALAIPLIAYAIAGSASVMAALYAVSMLPHLVFGVAGGAWADRNGKKRMIVTLSLASAAVLGVLALAISGRQQRLPLLFVGVFALSVLTSALLAAFDGALNEVVRPERRIKVISSLESTRTLTVILGPIIAGLLVSVWRGSLPLLIDALSFVLAAAIISTVRFAGVPGRGGDSAYRNLADSIREGLVYLWRTARLRYGVMLSTLNNAALGGFEVLVVYRLRQNLGVSSVVTGAVFASGGAAALLASLVVPRLAGRIGLLRGMCLGLLGLGAAGVLLGVAPDAWVVAVAQASFISSGLVFNVCWRTYRQNHCESTMISRVAGACRGIAYCGATFGSGLCAAMIALGVPVPVYLCAGGAMVFVLGVFSRHLLAARAEDGDGCTAGSP
ncbi:MFS transporter [Actinocrinis puniceicyclus]|uniref:MFS transporter n=1 Tax=Actinocrinis puniceicyclus TaxID=977794 RepID=A0A8J8BCJ3_9ACTN|nr:MFS transporter [Actinocrinis puniceicyclus]MBS2965167.1 MFS transporter [Actinocrinis puniceicyclus]